MTLTTSVLVVLSFAVTFACSSFLLGDSYDKCACDSVLQDDSYNKYTCSSHHGGDTSHDRLRSGRRHSRDRRQSRESRHSPDSHYGLDKHHLGSGRHDKYVCSYFCLALSSHYSYFYFHYSY